MTGVFGVDDWRRSRDIAAGTFFGFRNSRLFISKVIPFEFDSQRNETLIQSREREKDRRYSKKGKAKKGTKDWVMNKKERQRRQGKEVRPDSKYSGRRRKAAF